MKSVTLGVFTLFCVLVFSLTLLFIWNSSAGVSYRRVAMTGDRANEGVFPRPDSPSGEPVTATGEAGGPGETDSDGAGTPPEPIRHTVVWLSIPGFRGDYLEKAGAVFLGKMAAEGASTSRMTPGFPCLTHPAHATLATGTLPGVHGIPGDRFRVGTALLQPPLAASLLRAEPVWDTASRQGVPTLVRDWPFSGSHDSPAPDDETRLRRLWEAWTSRRDGPAARLVMARLDDILRAGLVHGPRAAETHEAVRRTDEQLRRFFEMAVAAWPNLRGSDRGNLVFLITTDHGMAEIQKNINLPHLLGEELMENLEIAAGDAVAHLYFRDLPGNTPEAEWRKKQIETELKRLTYARTFRREDLGGLLGFSPPVDRTGDLVLVLKTGFAFSDHRAEDPVFDPGVGAGFYGGFGFPVSDSLRMKGQVLMWSFPDQVARGDLGEIGQTGFHDVVCRLLGIRKAEAAAESEIAVSAPETAIRSNLR